MREFTVKYGGKLKRFIASKDKSTYVEKFLWKARHIHIPVLLPLRPQTYGDRVEAEQARFRDMIDVNELPPIFHYWATTHLRPIFDEFGIDHQYDWFAKHFLESALRDPDGPHAFASIGAGNCDTEVYVARRLKEFGLERFTIECLDMNVNMLERGRAMAAAEGVADCLRFVEADLNDWRAERLYTGFMANQSLHHIVNLEQLFSEVRMALRADGVFVISDIVGRNGHMRWPEALKGVHAFWQELPQDYRYNLMLKRHEEIYENWDCSNEGFEGIRAQDILPLLIERFHFDRFIGFGNVIDPFIDRCFGHAFDPESEWDRDFIDRIHAYDERGFADGSLTPTHMFAVVTGPKRDNPRYSRGLSPEACMRIPDAGMPRRAHVMTGGAS